MAAKFGLFVDEDHSKLPTLYWLPKRNKRPHKSRFIANSSACTTTELSILLTSCLTAIKNHVIKYCTTVYERNGKKLFLGLELAIDPPRGNFVHYNFLRLHYIRHKIKNVSPLRVAALMCNITLYTFPPKITLNVLDNISTMTCSYILAF